MKKIIKITADATSDLISNKSPIKLQIINHRLIQRLLHKQKKINKNVKRKIYSPRKRQQIIDELRLI